MFGYVLVLCRGNSAEKGSERYACDHQFEFGHTIYMYALSLYRNCCGLNTRSLNHSSLIIY